MREPPIRDVLFWAMFIGSLTLLLLVLIEPLARAQPAPTPNEQALSAKLLAELSASVACAAERITLQAELQKLKAEKVEPVK